MPQKISYSTLNASSKDILNVIRANASFQYQNMVPEIKHAKEVPAVGEAILGTPAIANEFMSAFMNMVALRQVKSATFNNPYVSLKKGFLSFGERVDEIFISMAKAREFSVEKAANREFKRTIPEAKSAFHVINWEVQYPTTVEEKDLQRAFLSMDGIKSVIADIINGVYTGAEYDEYLLFKYVLIKQISHGRVWVEPLTGNITDAAIKFRGFANALKFPSQKYNVANVRNNTPDSRLQIFMDSFYNAEFDVNVLASAFNMDKTTFVGKLRLIDDWGTFDNERFAEIMENTNMVEPVTAEELAITKNVKTVLVDERWFQFYDNMAKFTEKYVSSGMYWNYFYNVFKIISTSPFENCIAFVEGAPEELAPSSFTVKVIGVNKDKNATVVEIGNLDTLGLTNTSVLYEQNEAATKGGVGVLPYGVYLFPADSQAISPTAYVMGIKYTCDSDIDPSNVELDQSLTFTKVTDPNKSKKG